MERVKNSIKQIKHLKQYVNWKLLHRLKKPLQIGIAVFLAFLILTPVVTYLIFVWDLGSKESIINRNNAGVVLLDRNETPFFTFYEGQERKITPLSEIPQSIKQAVIAVEDKDFYEHPGFSIPSMIRALITNIKEERLAYGASTITQQLVKNALLSPEKSFLRKYQELILAAEIDRRYSKDDILEMYLNTVYFGEGAIGVQNAAQTYFGTNAHQLTLAQSALLTGILPAPSALSPLSGDQQRAFEKQKIVLRKMQEQGYITVAQKTQAENETVTFNPVQKQINLTAPHFALMVKDELIKKYGESQVAGSGLKVKTTIDLSMQKFAETTLQNQITRLRYNKASNGAVVVIDPKSAEILALAGSANWYDEEFGKVNMALSPRQPGSAFKPIIYAKALEDKIITPASVINDTPRDFGGGYKPKNYDGSYREKVLARRALANSLNIPSVEIMEKVGVSNGVEMARRFGITTLDDPSRYGLSLVLGTAEVPLIEMTNAYAVFANGGKLYKPTAILEIRNKKNSVIYTHQPSAAKVIDESVAYLISSILSDNAARSEVFGHSLTISRPAAVKTGTTEDYRDALTLGYTPSLVIGVWIGNNDNTPMSAVAGAMGAAPIWKILMERYLKTTPVESFPQPFDVSSLMVCSDNGLVAKIATTSAYQEYFIRGTEPQMDCAIPTPTPSPAPTSTPEPTPTNEPEEQPTPTDTPFPTPSLDLTPTPTQIPTATPIPTSIPTSIPSAIPTP